MSKRKRNFFSYFILLIFTCQLGLLFSASLFDSSDTIKQLSSLTDESDDDDSDTEESELDFFKVIHQEDLLFPSSLCEVRMIKSAKFNSINELACNQIDFKTPFSPPEIV